MRNSVLSAAICASLLVSSAPQLDASPAEPEFDVVMVAMSATTWEAIKYNTQTGEAWIASDGKWVPVEDIQVLPKGKYVIRMTALSNDWSAIRFEAKSGQSWQCRERKWVEITHAAQAPDEKAAAPQSSQKTNSEHSLLPGIEASILGK